METDESQKSLPYDPDWIPTDIETWLLPAIMMNIFFPIMKNIWLKIFFISASAGGHITFFGKILILIFLAFFVLWFLFHLSVALDNKGHGIFGKFRYVWRKLFLLVASVLPMLPHIFILFYIFWYG